MALCKTGGPPALPVWTFCEKWHEKKPDTEKLLRRSSHEFQSFLIRHFLISSHIVMSTDGPYPPLPDPSTLPHDSLAPNIIVCAVVTWAIAAVFVALRFYTRTRILSVIGWSDWLILISWIFSCGVTAGAIEQSQRGIGRHVYDYDWMANLTPFQKVSPHLRSSQKFPRLIQPCTRVCID